MFSIFDWLFFIPFLRVSLMSFTLFSSPVEHFYDHYFKFSVLVISISLRSLAVILPCSFIWHIFLCLILSNSMSVSVCLEYQYLPLLKIMAFKRDPGVLGWLSQWSMQPLISGLWVEPHIGCRHYLKMKSAVPHVCQNLALQRCLLCVLYVSCCCVLAMFPFSPGMCHAFLCLLWAVFGPQVHGEHAVLTRWALAFLGNDTCSHCLDWAGVNPQIVCGGRGACNFNKICTTRTRTKAIQGEQVGRCSVGKVCTWSSEGVDP